MSDGKLTSRQIDFCNQFAIQGFAEQGKAYQLTLRKKGATLRTCIEYASKLMRKPEIIEYLDELKLENKKKMRMTIDSALDELIAIKQDLDNIKLRPGKENTYFTHRIKIVELSCKLCGLLNEKRDITLTARPYKALSDEEIATLLAK